MKFLCDVHISYKVQQFLNKAGYECFHINQLLQGDVTSDTDIARFCNENNIILVSKDQDFTDTFLLKKLPGKFIKISLGNISTSHLIELLQTALPVIEELYQRKHFMIEIHKHSIQVIDS